MKQQKNNCTSNYSYFRSYTDVNFILNLNQFLCFHFINSIFAAYENICTNIIIRFCKFSYYANCCLHN